VSHALNAFANECFMDECAAAAGKDPVAYRRELLAGQARYLNVLNLAAEKSGWGTPAPAGRSRGVAVMEGYGSYLALVAEVSTANNQIRVHRAVIAADVGMMVNPNIVQQQIESSLIFGLSSTLHGEITIKDGGIAQNNFNDYPVLRMNESPSIEIHMVASKEPPGGIGEPITAMISPAVANAVASGTGKRLRSLPLRLA
jgi:isoquinoline 1-oxidoreductase subunit beta